MQRQLKIRKAWITWTDSLLWQYHHHHQHELIRMPGSYWYCLRGCMHERQHMILLFSNLSIPSPAQKGWLCTLLVWCFFKIKTIYNIQNMHRVYDVMFSPKSCEISINSWCKLSETKPDVQDWVRYKSRKKAWSSRNMETNGILKTLWQGDFLQSTRVNLKGIWRW